MLETGSCRIRGILTTKEFWNDKQGKVLFSPFNSKWLLRQPEIFSILILPCNSARSSGKLNDMKSHRIDILSGVKAPDSQVDLHC